jgi:hypothetical protein
VLIVAIVPVLHGSSMLGGAILEPISSRWPAFDSFYNRHPWMLSLSAGILFALAWSARAHHVVAISIAAIGALLAIADLIGMLLSIVAFAQRKQR